MGMQSPSPPSSDRTSDWPHRLPSDLKLRLLDSLSFATVTADDLWDDIREWLTEHEVKPGSGMDLTAGQRLSRESGSQKYTPPLMRSADAKKIVADADQSSDRLFAEATERRRLVDLENAVIDYAAKFGVSDAARIAMASGIRK